MAAPRATIKEVVLLGTGASDAVPYVPCVLGLTPGGACSACKEGQSTVHNHNKRRQTSALVIIQDAQEQQRNILIDCGPMFTDTAQILKRHNVRRLDAVLLTHDHTDAAGGLPLLRPFIQQNYQKTIHLYATKATKQNVERDFQWMFNKNQPNLGMSMQELPDRGSIDLFGVKVDIFPVRHGGTAERPYNSCGFLFDERFAYISDVTEIPPESWAVLEAARNKHLKQSGKGIPLLVIDWLKMQHSPWHSGIGKNIARAHALKCQRTVFTQIGHGLSHAQLDACCKAIEKQISSNEIKKIQAFRANLKIMDHHKPLDTADFYYRELGISDWDTEKIVRLALSEVLAAVPDYHGGVFSEPGYDGQVREINNHGPNPYQEVLDNVQPQRSGWARKKARQVVQGIRTK